MLIERARDLSSNTRGWLTAHRSPSDTRPPPSCPHLPVVVRVLRILATLDLNDNALRVTVDTVTEGRDNVNACAAYCIERCEVNEVELMRPGTLLNGCHGLLSLRADEPEIRAEVAALELARSDFSARTAATKRSLAALDGSNGDGDDEEDEYEDDDENAGDFEDDEPSTESDETSLPSESSGSAPPLFEDEVAAYNEWRAAETFVRTIEPEAKDWARTVFRPGERNLQRREAQILALVAKYNERSRRLQELDKDRARLFRLTRALIPEEAELEEHQRIRAQMEDWLVESVLELVLIWHQARGRPASPTTLPRDA
ncbi:hypothetical protein JCM10212_004794 [Sporobolomyces blumeae]